jgi:hypothetical protein
VAFPRGLHDGADTTEIQVVALVGLSGSALASLGPDRCAARLTPAGAIRFLIDPRGRGRGRPVAHLASLVPWPRNVAAENRRPSTTTR